MLKTKIAKAFCLCISLLFISTSFTGNPLHSRSLSYREGKNIIEADLIHTGASTSIIDKTDNDRNPSAKGTSPHSGKPQISLNSTGMLFVKKYIKKSSECLVSVKKRSTIPFSIIDSVFSLYGLPVELKYLAVIESELKPTALSHVGARGPWQFMPGTANILGLKTTHLCDERTNYYKSTVAAAKYLKDLYAQFNDWLLVLAAYNGGPRPVYTAIRESGSKNFWLLQDYLPAESREHVKKFIATHYYFEGRGSETTLTRAENAEFKRTVKEFIKYRVVAKIAVKGKTNMINSIVFRKSNKPEINFNMNQLVGFEIKPPVIDLQKSQNIVRQLESPEDKFRRLMKESEECLKRSRKII